MFRSIAAASLLLLGTSAIAQQPQATGSSEKSADPGDKIICKKFLETGSLVRATKICKTKRDWERDRDDLRQSSVADSCRARAAGGSC